MMLTLVPSYRPTKSEEEGRILQPPNVADDGDLAARYEELRARGKAELDAGNLEEALRIFDTALALAEGIGDREKVDLAFCNRTAVALTLGQSYGACEALREVLVRNHGVTTNHFAAYNLSRAYELKRESKKAVFYARIALNHAYAAENNEWIAWSHNQVGNCLVADSYFAEASAEYREALELFPEELSVFRVGTLDNLAYSKAVEGHLKEAFSILFKCLRWSRRSGARFFESRLHLDLCYCYTEIGRLRLAWRHGRKALQLAEASGDQDVIKLALFLMGDIEKAGGDTDVAYEYFSRLQREFYPEVANLPEMMLVVDARKVVNLRA